MNSNVVTQLASALRDTWNPYLQVAPILEFDGSWPSVGVLDLLTFPLRLKGELEPEHDRGIRQASAYLATMIEPLWSKLGANVSFNLSEVDGVRLRAQGGEHIPEGQTVELLIEKALRRSLLELPCPFPVMTDYQRMISFDSNILSLFGIGALSGLSPFVTGAWEMRTIDEHRQCLQIIGKELARQTAENYARVFPDEPFGQVAELYLRQLIFPPALLNEALPALQAVNGLLAFFEEYKVSESGRLQLTRNLSLSPDDLLSCAGIALHLALCKQIPAPEVLGAAKAKGKFLGLLRMTMQHARERLGSPRDWLSKGIASPEDELRFSIEQAAGTIPWLYLNLERVKEGAEDPKLLKLLDAMSVFELDEAQKACDEMVELDPSDLPLRLQRVRLMIVSGDLERADEMFRALLSEPASDDSAEFYSLWGQCALAMEQNDRAHSYFKAGMALSNIDPLVKSDLANNLAWTCILRGEAQEALQHIDTSLETAVCPVTPLLNRAHVLWATEEFQALKKVRLRLFEIAPCDRRVFAGLTALNPQGKAPPVS